MLVLILSQVTKTIKKINIIDRSSSISQVHAFNVTDSCYRMTRKLNESNAGWKSSTQAPILEVGWINILCSTSPQVFNVPVEHDCDYEEGQ